MALLVALAIPFAPLTPARAVTLSKAPGSPLGAGYGRKSVAVGDFNGDGHLDLAFTMIYPEGTVSIFLGNGDGSFTQAPGSPLTLMESPEAVAVGDFNGDGHPDLAVSGIQFATPSGEEGVVSVLLGNGNGGFTPSSGSPFVFCPVSFNCAWGAFSDVEVGDFDRNGHPDLAVVNGTGEDVSILLGDGSGGFSAASGSPIRPLRPSAVGVADFNGDGKPDLAIAEYFHDAGNRGTVSVYLGDGNGGFTFDSVIATGGRETPSLAVGDFTGDGRLDLALPNEGSNSVSMLVGNGAGGFTQALGSPFAVGARPASLAVWDVNGHISLVSANAAAETVSVLTAGGGSFHAASGSPFAIEGGWLTSVRAGDFNGDGAPDIAVGAVNGVSVLLNVPPQTSTSELSGATRKRSATFVFSSDQAPATFECQLDGGSWDSCGSPVTYSALAAGPHSFEVRASNDVGIRDPTPAASSWTVDLTTPPSATLTASPTAATAGQPVTLDASGSHDSLDGTIVDYQWDVEGNGNFSRDTGSTPSTAATYSVPGTFHPEVRVTNEVGASATATATVDIRPAPPQGEVGISINNGDYATNTTAVQLDVVWPALASNLLISNDGGFSAAGETQTMALSPTVGWALRSEGSDRLPKIVYARFPGSPSSTQTFTDDIILDTTTPVVQSASTVESEPAAATVSAVHRKQGFHVQLKAAEKLSGISAAQFSSTHRGGTTVTFAKRTSPGIRRLARIVRVQMSKRPRYVRVASAAGNWSKWHRITRPNRR